MLDRDAVGECAYTVKRDGFSGFQRALHAGGVLRLHAVDFYLGVQRLDGARNAGNQPAAADGADDRIHIRQLIENFQTDCALTGDNFLIVEGVDEGHAGFLLQLAGVVVGVVIRALNEADLRAEGFGGFDLADRRAVGHTDNRLDTHAGRGERDTLRVVARGAGNNAGFALFLVQLADFIVCAAQFE